MDATLSDSSERPARMESARRHQDAGPLRVMGESTEFVVIDVEKQGGRKRGDGVARGEFAALAAHLGIEVGARQIDEHLDDVEAFPFLVDRVGENFAFQTRCSIPTSRCR